MRFGILGTANIALHATIPAIAASDHEVTAIASRDVERARTAADDHGIAHSYGDYGALLDEAPVDAVYVPLPNAHHAEWTLRALNAGHHVLCEKPLATDADEAAALFDHAADADRTLMEAVMYRFHPRTRRLREVVETELGEIRSAEATFTFALRDDPENVRLSAELAGGSRMDVGTYVVTAIRGVLGQPDRVHAHALDSRDCGVDTDLRATLMYDDRDTHGTVRTSLDTPRHERLRVDAVDGWLEAPDCFYTGRDGETEIRYAVDDREVTETFPPTNHYAEMVDAFAAAAESGSEPPVTRQDSVDTARVLDALAESAATGESVEVAEDHS